MGGAKAASLSSVDHQGNPSLTSSFATRLIIQDNVHVLMGAYQSSCSFTATAVAERYGIPFMVGKSAAGNITGRGLNGYSGVHQSPPIMHAPICGFLPT